MKNTVRTGKVTLAALTLLLYLAEGFIIEFTSLPYTLLASLGILFIDLYLCSPIKAGCTTMCWHNITQSKCNHSFWYYGFTPATYGKSVVLRASIWKKRVVRYTVFLVPSAFLSVLSERFYSTTYLHNAQPFGLLCHIGAWTLLVIGVLFAEICLLRYKAAWFLIPMCNSAKEALNTAKNLSVCCLEDIVQISLANPFSIINKSFASWIATQMQHSRHVYIFSEYTNNSTGTSRVQIISDGGNEYERA